MKKETYFKKIDAIRKKATDFSLNKSGTVGVEPMGDSSGNRWAEVKLGKLGSVKVDPSEIKKTVKNVVNAPGKILKKQWNKNQAFRNKNSTEQKFRQNSK